MKTRTPVVLAVATTAGVSSALLAAAAPAYAASEACGANTGVVVAPGICELDVTFGHVTFLPTVEMTQLEALLVGAGGSGADTPDPNSTGYASAGGGGQVKIVDFSGSTDPMAIQVAGIGTQSSVITGARTESVGNGGTGGERQGGGSGTLPGAAPAAPMPPYSAGAGAGASPVTDIDGGAGVVVSDLAGPGSLFAGDDRCFGGGGAVGAAGVQGLPGCGGGGPADASGTLLNPPVPNSGGGGGGVTDPNATGQAGAAGRIILRWTAATVTVDFDTSGRGAALTSQSVPAGSVLAMPTPADVDGYRFDGWFRDAAFTAPVDPAAPVTASTTYYARWVPALAATGADVSPAVIAGALAALAAGGGLVFVARRRRSADD